MYERRFIWLLLLPSVLSGACVTGLTIAVLGYSGWLYIGQNQLFYDTLFGAYGLNTFLWELSGDTPAWQQAFSHSPAAYYIFIAGCAVAAGLLVYSVLESAGAALRRTSEVWHAPRGEELRKTWMRFGLRITGLVGWTAYFAFFVSTIIPVSVLMVEAGIDRLETNIGVSLAYWAVASGLLITTTHMHVIFMRLCMLRPRVFGDQDIEEAEIAASQDESHNDWQR